MRSRHGLSREALWTEGSFHPSLAELLLVPWLQQPNPSFHMAFPICTHLWVKLLFFPADSSLTSVGGISTV